MGTFFRVIGASGSDEDRDAGEDETEGSLRGTRTHIEVRMRSRLSGDTPD